jgi:hypothetical protein
MATATSNRFLHRFLVNTAPLGAAARELPPGFLQFPVLSKEVGALHMRLFEYKVFPPLSPTRYRCSAVTSERRCSRPPPSEST